MGTRMIDAETIDIAFLGGIVVGFAISSFVWWISSRR
jgi:hypothetical protein